MPGEKKRETGREGEAKKDALVFRGGCSALFYAIFHAARTSI